MKSKLSGLRFLLLVPAMASLLAGVLSGLGRLGWAVPIWAVQLVGVHGALMIGGFFGTLIGLERAVALARLWPYAAPALSGLAALCLIADPASGAAPYLMAGGALVMTTACTEVWWRQRVAHLAGLAVGALAWWLGNLVWIASGSIVAAVPLWAAFLVLTIAAERLELSRLVPTPLVARRVFAAIVAILMLGALVAAASSLGLRLFAVSLIALALWLLRYDIARRTIRSQGLTKYMAVCLLSGYVWLGLAGVLGVAGGFVLGSPMRDPALHALLLGFVFSMVFGHAPVILPAITRLRMRWHEGFYLPLLALHLTLVTRVWAGLNAQVQIRQYGALGNALVLLLFMLTVVLALRGGARSVGMKTGQEAAHGTRS